MRDAKRHLATTAVLGAFLALNTATSKRPVPGGGPGPAPVYADAAIAAPALPHATAADLDVAAATRALCTGRAGDPCRILAEFASATELKELPATGQDVWFGFSYALGGTADKRRELFFLQIQRGYTPSPDPALDSAVLDVSGSARTLTPDGAAEDKDAIALLMALRKGDPAPPANKAAEYMTTNAPKQWRAIVGTAGGSLALLTDASAPHIFVRKSGKRVLVVEYDRGKLFGHADKGLFAKAWCAELYKLQ